MVRKVVQTLMYLRGQMATTWDQLEVLLMQENMRQEQELEQGSQSREDSFYHDPHIGTRNHAQDEDDDTENDFIIPTKSLREVTTSLCLTSLFSHLINSCSPLI